MTFILPFLLLASACGDTDCDDTGGNPGGDTAHSTDGGSTGTDSGSDGGSTDGGAGDGGSDGGSDGGAVEGEALDDEEQKGLATWGASRVDFLVGPDETVVTGNEVMVVMEDLSGSFDLVTTTLRASDYNSSRSNRTTAAVVDLGGGDGDPALLSWDGRTCTTLPCSGDYREEGQISQLSIDMGERDSLAAEWGETTPRSVGFGGYVSLGATMSFRCHVTVLKATSSDEGVHVNVASDAVNFYILNDDEVVYEGRWSTEIAIKATDGSGYPYRVELVTTEKGTEMSLLW